MMVWLMVAPPWAAWASNLKAGSPLPNFPDWSIQEIRIDEGEGVLKKAFLLTPPEGRQARAVTVEMASLLQNGGIDPETAYHTSAPATQLHPEQALLDEEPSPLENQSQASNSTPSSPNSTAELDQMEATDPRELGKAFRFKGRKAPPETIAPQLAEDAAKRSDGSKKSALPSGEETAEVPGFAGWKIQRINDEESPKRSTYALSPPDERPTRRIVGGVAERLFAGGMDAETAYRTALAAATKAKGTVGESTAAPSLATHGGDGATTAGGGRAPATHSASSPKASATSNETTPPPAKTAPAKTDTSQTSNTNATESKKDVERPSIVIGQQRSRSSRCTPRHATSTTKTTSATPPPPAPPPPPPSNRTLQALTDIWMDKPGAHRGTITPSANCPKGYTAHPYYADKSGVSGIISDVGYDGFMGGGTFFCYNTDPEETKIVTDVKITDPKSKATSCPQGYEAQGPFVNCTQGFGAACSGPLLLQNFCLKKEPIASAKTAVVDFGITPTISAALAHLSDVPCPDGYQNIGNVTSCGGAAAFCSGLQNFCLKSKPIPPPENGSGSTATATMTSVSTTVATPEVSCLDGDDGTSGAGFDGNSNNGQSDITGTEEDEKKRKSR